MKGSSINGSPCITNGLHYNVHYEERQSKVKTMCCIYLDPLMLRNGQETKDKYIDSSLCVSPKTRLICILVLILTFLASGCSLNTVVY